VQRVVAAPAEDRLVWLDLEMTGLDVEHDAIVEIACIVTDSRLEVLDDGIQLVVHQDDAVLATMDEFVRAMHEKSGLLPEISTSPIELAAAEQQVLAYVRGHVTAPATAPLCGNSIGMDRRFLARYMPDLDKYFHYRSIDVSSFKELCRRWYPRVYRKRPNKAEQHRALGDIRESLAELRYYRETILRPPDAT
jgi:oligoribonuclease